MSSFHSHPWYLAHCSDSPQGNLDPAGLLAPHARIETEVETILAAYGSGEGHIFNLGHGITPEADPEAGPTTEGGQGHISSSFRRRVACIPGRRGVLRNRRRGRHESGSSD